MSPSPFFWRHAVSPEKLALVDRWAEGETVLDVGCGAGLVCLHLAQLGKTVIGIEPNYAGAEPHGWRLIRASVPPISLPDKSVDTAVLFDVLEHIDDDEALLAELQRVTRTRLILSVPSNDDGELPRYGLCLLHHIDKTHRREYALKTLEALLSKYGFKVRLAQKACPNGAPQVVTAFFVNRWYAKPLQWITNRWIRLLQRVGIVRVDLAADWLLVADKVIAHQRNLGVGGTVR